MDNKKGQAMQTLAGLAVGVATLTITLVVTFLILGQGQTQIVEIEGLGGVDSNSSLALNATNTLESAVSQIPGWVPLIIIAVVGSALLGLVALFRR